VAFLGGDPPPDAVEAARIVLTDLVRKTHAFFSLLMLPAGQRAVKQVAASIAGGTRRRALPHWPSVLVQDVELDPLGADDREGAAAGRPYAAWPTAVSSRKREIVGRSDRKSVRDVISRHVWRSIFEPCQRATAAWIAGTSQDKGAQARQGSGLRPQTRAECQSLRE